MQQQWIDTHRREVRAVLEGLCSLAWARDDPEAAEWLDHVAAALDRGEFTPGTLAAAALAVGAVRAHLALANPDGHSADLEALRAVHLLRADMATDCTQPP